MTIQSLLNEGGVQCTGLEKVADATLLLPRVLWKGRNVQVLSGPSPSIKDEEYSNLSTKYINFVRGINGNYSSAILLIPVSIVFAVFNLIATPLLLLGLGLKKISLACDPKASAYHAIVANQLKLDDIAQKKKMLEKSLVKAEADVNNAPDIYVATILKHLLKEIQNKPKSQVVDKSKLKKKEEPQKTSAAFNGLIAANMATFVKDLIYKIKAKHKLKDEIEELEKSTPKIQRQIEEGLQILSSMPLFDSHSAHNYFFNRSRICTAFKAAPLSNWSPTTHKSNVWGHV